MQYETTLTRAMTDEHRASGAWPDRSLADALAAAVARHPQKTAVIDARRSVTYEKLRERADECALGLLDLGVRKGDSVVVQLPNWHEFVVATLALLSDAPG